MSLSESIIDAPPERAPVAPPRARRSPSGAGPADINETGTWLIPRLCERFKTTPNIAKSFLSSALVSNDRRLVVSGTAIGMIHTESGMMGQPPRAVVDFVLAENKADGHDDLLDVFAWFSTWAKLQGCSAIYDVDTFSDLDKSWIRDALGPLTRRNTYVRLLNEE